MTSLDVNGELRTVAAAADCPLLYVLRNDLGLEGTRFGCGDLPLKFGGGADRNAVRPWRASDRPKLAARISRAQATCRPSRVASRMRGISSLAAPARVRARRASAVTGSPSMRAVRPSGW